jgi:hypothetical protein
MDSRIELIVAWSLSSYRGCVVATEIGPKICMFYVNGTPERENRFAEKAGADRREIFYRLPWHYL